uniref:Uncharacterized protein n=1 Tax=Sciurus vulgaris TaxID=55149 RepID=A0A8D2AL54_SCIVU
MEETIAEFIRRTILKTPTYEMMTILKAWVFFFFFFFFFKSENQLQSINFQQGKECLVQDLVLLCEKCSSLNDTAHGDIIYIQYCRCAAFSTTHLHIQQGNELF